MSNLQEKKQKSVDEIPKKTPKEKNLMPAWKKGESGNPNGRPAGAKNFTTLFNEAINKIAKERNIKSLEAETDLVVKAYLEARRGNFNYYRDIMDRKFGKPKETIEHEVSDKLGALMAKIHADKQPLVKPESGDPERDNDETGLRGEFTG